jgi:hypothetical protein
LTEGFDFIGFEFVKRRSPSSGKPNIYIHPSKSSQRNIRRRIKSFTKRRAPIRPAEFVKEVNQTVRGWMNYYRHTNASDAFRGLQRFINTRFRRYLNYRSKGRGFGWKKYPNAALYTLGIIYIGSGVIRYEWKSAHAVGQRLSDRRTRENWTSGGMGREWWTGQGDASEALQKGKPAETDRRPLKSLSHSFTLDIILGFQHQAEADRFLEALRERLAKFGLELHPEKTRRIEFGRFAEENRKRRGEDKPETFDFLGFKHISGKNGIGRFTVRRTTIRTRMRAKLRQIKQELRTRMHDPVPQTGEWLKSVVQGYFNYHAVPGNLKSLAVFRDRTLGLWWRTLRRRSQQRRFSWTRMLTLGHRWLPQPRVLHPYPADRFAVSHPR